jgi:UDPglucose 6-dehydrogenase
LAEKNGYDFRILRSVREVNEAQKAAFIHLIEDKLWIIKDKTIAVWGLAFKANTDDMREASSVTLVNDLLAAGATITAYDPVAMGQARRVWPDCAALSYAESQTLALQQADALLIVTEWKEFRSPDFPMIQDTLKQAVIFDGRNLYDPQMVRGMGFEYFAIGR